jgi:sulfatase modifying factor 1
MNITSRVALSLLLISGLIISPRDSFAGGGGSGSKSKVNVRVKNMTASTTNSPLVAIETVAVGDPNNDPIMVNSQMVGQVAESFRIARYEVTIAEYITFLNAVAKRGDGANAAVVASLYDSRMATDANIAGISRIGDGTASSPYVYSVIGDLKKPIAYVDWYSAARFANWMHNGATATADIETGAYNLTAGSYEFTPRDSGAKWWIPSHDEWFKAAYYKGGGTSAGYWMFPTRSDTVCENTPSTGSNHANSFSLGLYAITQLATLDTTQNYLTAVGTFVNSPSPYGTFDQGGNVEEWTDTLVYGTFGAARFTRGGAWNTGGLNDDVNPVPTALPSDRSNKSGFRLARSADDTEPAANPSRAFNVAVSNSNSSPGRVVVPGQVTQFKVNKGAYKISVEDTVATTVTQVLASNTGTRKTIYIEVSGDGTQISILDTTTNRF